MRSRAVVETLSEQIILEKISDNVRQIPSDYSTDSEGIARWGEKKKFLGVPCAFKGN